MATDRSELTSRILPEMQFCTTDAPAPKPADLKTGPTSNPALERFSVTGNAIVTGGSGDLGSSAIRALLQHGLGGLAIFDVDPVEATKRIDSLQEEFPSTKFVFKKVDITKVDEVDQAVDEVASELGGIHLLLNFAGIVCCVHSLDAPVDEWRKVLDVNTNGTFIVAQAVAKRMVAAKTGGSMIFIASLSAHRVNYPQPQAAYNASKAAVLMIKNCLAAEWAGYGIRVNSISPGYMDTILNAGDGLERVRKVWLSRNPMGRLGDREELTGAVVLLASRAGSYINGADIAVDGGYMAC